MSDEKIFHMGEKALTFADTANGAVNILICEVVGVRKFHTSVSEYSYLVQDPFGQVLWRLPCDMWLTLEDLKTALEGRVTGRPDEIH